jgi:hypothetical protein
MEASGAADERMVSSLRLRRQNPIDRRQSGSDVAPATVGLQIARGCFQVLEGRAEALTG